MTLLRDIKLNLDTDKVYIKEGAEKIYIGWLVTKNMDIEL